MSDAASVGKRIVVGVDGSDCSVTAISFAIEEAGFRGAMVQAIYAFVSPTLVGIPAPQGYFDGLERQARELLDEAIAKATPATGATPQIVRTVVSGPPGEALIAASRGAALLVVGSRGRGGFRELLLGSVSSQCVHHAHCPVTVIRP
jgi:nucleotide-binding universal stress UspA family protein